MAARQQQWQYALELIFIFIKNRIFDLTVPLSTFLEKGDIRIPTSAASQLKNVNNSAWSIERTHGQQPGMHTVTLHLEHL